MGSFPLANNCLTPSPAPPTPPAPPHPARQEIGSHPLDHSFENQQERVTDGWLSTVSGQQLLPLSWPWPKLAQTFIQRRGGGESFGLVPASTLSFWKKLGASHLPLDQKHEWRLAARGCRPSPASQAPDLGEGELSGRS